MERHREQVKKKTKRNKINPETGAHVQQLYAPERWHHGFVHCVRLSLCVIYTHPPSGPVYRWQYRNDIMPFVQKAKPWEMLACDKSQVCPSFDFPQISTLVLPVDSCKHMHTSQFRNDSWIGLFMRNMHFSCSNFSQQGVTEHHQRIPESVPCIVVTNASSIVCRHSFARFHQFNWNSATLQTILLILQTNQIWSIRTAKAHWKLWKFEIFSSWANAGNTKRVLLSRHRRRNLRLCSNWMAWWNRLYRDAGTLRQTTNTDQIPCNINSVYFTIDILRTQSTKNMQNCVEFCLVGLYFITDESFGAIKHQNNSCVDFDWKRIRSYFFGSFVCFVCPGNGLSSDFWSDIYVTFALRCLHLSDLRSI